MGQRSDGERAAAGSTAARFGIYAFLFWDLWRGLGKPGALFTRESLAGVTGAFALFELAVFILRRYDRQLAAPSCEAFRRLATRYVVLFLAAELAVLTAFTQQLVLLFSTGFVAFAAFVAASYVPDALFGGSRFVADVDETGS